MKLGGGKEWFSALELAELALPGLPRTKRKINQDWVPTWTMQCAPDGTPLARKRASQGGGMEYHFSVLPPAARSALVARGITAIADIVPEPVRRGSQLWSWYDGLNDKAKAKAQFRLDILQRVERYRLAGMDKSQAVFTVAARTEPSVSTIWSWFELVAGVPADDWLPCLAPRYSGGGVEAEIDPQVWQVFKSDYLRKEKPPLSECYLRTVKWAAKQGLTILPCSRSFERKLKREVPAQVIVLCRMSDEELRRMLPSQRRSVLDLHAMEAVNIDGHTFDVFVNYGKNEKGEDIIERPILLGIQDVFSRKLLAWRLCRSENSLDVRLVIAQLLRDWGIPKHFVFDNGRAFASKWITGGIANRFRFSVKDDEPLGVVPALGIEVHWATPFRGQSKPIERAWLDLTKIIATHPETSGAYTGNKPDAKPENYATAAVPFEQFARLVDRGIAAYNARTGRRTETAHGRYSFDQVFEESYASSKIGIAATPEQLRMALLTAEQKRLDSKTGELSLEGNRYWAPEFADHRGARVLVRFDPDNLHGEVHVYAHSGEFIATAPAIAKTGFFDKAAAGKRRKQEADWRRQTRELQRLEELLPVSQLAQMLDDGDDEMAPDPIAPRVVEPRRHRGQTAAALKPISEAAEQPRPTPVIDRLAKLTLIQGGQ